MDTVTQTLILGVVVAMAPILTVLLTQRAEANKQAARVQEERDIRLAREAREDLVAERAAAAVKAAQISADRSIKASKATASALEISSREVAGKLEVIHLLVNSNLTAAKQAQYDAMAISLAFLHEKVELKKAAGEKPLDTLLEAIAAAEIKVEALRIELDERNRQAKVVEDQQAIQRDVGQAKAAIKQIEATDKQIVAAETQIEAAKGKPNV